MAAIDYSKLFKDNTSEIEDYKNKILDLLEDEEKLKKAVHIIEQLINEKDPL
jgi:hypothetical protein